MPIPEGKDFLEVLEELTIKGIKDLDDDEKAFIRARQYYLTPGQLDKFADLLVQPSMEEPAPRTAKKTKARL